MVASSVTRLHWGAERRGGNLAQARRVHGGWCEPTTQRDPAWQRSIQLDRDLRERHLRFPARGRRRQRRDRHDRLAVVGDAGHWRALRGVREEPLRDPAVHITVIPGERRLLVF